MTDSMTAGLLAPASTVLPRDVLAADRAAAAIEQLRLCQSRVAELELAGSELDARWSRLQVEALRLSDEAERARRDTLAATAHANRLEAGWRELSDAVFTAKQEADAAREALSGAQSKAIALEDALTLARAQYAAILSSRSWRLLSPMLRMVALLLGRR